MTKLTPTVEKKEDTIEIVEEWRKNWAVPELSYLDKDGNKVVLREHRDGECPVIFFDEDKNRDWEYIKTTRKELIKSL